MAIASAAAFTGIESSKALAGFQSDAKSADLWFGGDVNLGDGGYGQLQGISGIVQGAVGIVNLEGPVAACPASKAGALRLWNAPTALPEISGLNVKVAGIANNHSGDAGPRGPAQTAARLRDQGILPAGGPAGPALLKINGITIAVTAHDLTRGVPASLEKDLLAARKTAAILIATFHVTGPPSYLPRPELRQAVAIAYRAGALVIAAHGVHVVGPLERRDHAVIAWGLGNLAFACDCTNEQDAILLRLRLEPDRVVKAEVFPIQAGVNGKPAKPSTDAEGIFDLLEAIGSGKLERKRDVAAF